MCEQIYDLDDIFNILRNFIYFYYISFTEQNYNSINDLGIIVPSQIEQQNPLTFHPAVWLDDDASISLDNNDHLDVGNQFDEINIDPDFVNVNYPVSGLTTFDGEDRNGRVLEAENNFSPLNFNIDDYMMPFSGKQYFNITNLCRLVIKNNNIK